MHLAFVVVIAVKDVRILSVVTEIDPAREIEDELDVVDAVGRVDHSHVNEELAATQVELLDDAHHDRVDSRGHFPGPVADLFRRHGGIDLAQQVGVPVPAVVVRERDIRVYRE